MAHSDPHGLNHILNRIGKVGGAEEHGGSRGKEHLDGRIRVRIPGQEVHQRAELLVEKELVLQNADLGGLPALVGVAPQELPLTVGHVGGDTDNLVILLGGRLGLDKAERDRESSRHP